LNGECEFECIQNVQTLFNEHYAVKRLIVELSNYE
jgi:hypothetical protein